MKHSYVYDIDVSISEHDYSTCVQCKTIQRKNNTPTRCHNNRMVNVNLNPPTHWSFLDPRVNREWNHWNLSIGSALVRTSAIWSYVETYWTWMSWHSWYSQMMWCWISKCLVQQWNSGLETSWMAL